MHFRGIGTRNLLWRDRCKWRRVQPPAKSHKQSAADRSELIIILGQYSTSSSTSDSTERPKRHWQISNPIATPRCAPPLRAIPESASHYATAPQFTRTHDPPARNRSPKWRRECGCEADHLGTHARGADRRAAAAAARCRRARRRLIGGEVCGGCARGFVHCDW